MNNINIRCYKKFVITNSLIMLLLSLFYIPFAVDAPNNLMELIFLATTHIGCITIVAAICSVILFPAVFLPRIVMRLILAISVAVLLMALLIDIIIYSQHKMHLSIISPALLALKVMTFERIETFIFIAVFFILFAFEFYLVSRSIPESKNINRRYYYTFASVISICMIVSYGLFALSRYEAQQKLVKVASYIAFFNATNELKPLLKLNGIKNTQTHSISKLLLPKLYNKKYNIKPINYDAIASPKNILILAIDAWRADKLNSTDTPCLWKYAQKGKVFTNHMAAGNNTQVSTFGLLYGVPSGYYAFFTASKQSPILIDRLQQLNYQIGIFYSANIKEIELNRNIFSNIEDLRLGSTAATPALRDEQATNDWIEWFNNKKQQPAFSFIFYDSVHEYDFPPEFNQEYTPLRGEKRYKEIAAEFGQDTMNELYGISVSYVDSLAGKVLSTLEQSGELENTLVVITSDHGHELDDYGHKSWGHGSNLSSAQIHVPFVIIDKKFNNTTEPLECNKLTSHFDLVPTLLGSYLGATNDAEDYSIGYNLLQDNLEHEWVLVTGRDRYIHYFGVCDENYRVKLLPSGFYRLFDINNNILSDVDLNYNHINKAFHYIKKFIH